VGDREENDHDGDGGGDELDEEATRVEDERTQTTSPDWTITWTDLAEDFKEIECWTVSLTTYSDPDGKR
jgi:lysozyme family protein